MNNFIIMFIMKKIKKNLKIINKNKKNFTYSSNKYTSNIKNTNIKKKKYFKLYL